MDIASLLLEKLIKTQENGNLAVEADLCFKLGLCLKLSGDLLQSCRYFLAALELSHEAEKISLTIKCCEELCKVYTYFESIPHYEYYLGQVLGAARDSKTRGSNIICLHHVMEILCYAYVSEYRSIGVYVTEMTRDFLFRIREFTDESTVSLQFIQCSSFLDLLERKCIGEGIKKLLDASITTARTPTDKLYSALVLGVAALFERNTEEALRYFETQNHIAKELQNVPLLMQSYYFLMRGHLCKKDLSLVTLSHQLLRELVNGKPKICKWLLRNASQLVDLGTKAVGKSENQVLMVYLKDLAEELNSDIDLDGHHLTKQLKTAPLREALFVFQWLNLTHIECVEALRRLCTGDDIRSRCFKGRMMALSLAKEDLMDVSEMIDFCQVAFSIQSRDSTSMILRDEVLMLLYRMKSSSFQELMGTFLDTLHKDFKDPAEGFDYFSSRKVSKTVLSLVGGNFNMKSRSGEGAVGLDPNVNIRLPSSRIFFPKRRVMEEETLTERDDKVSQMGTFVEVVPAIKTLKYDTVRMIDLTCLGVPLKPKTLQAFWQADEMRVSCLGDEFVFCSSLRKLILVLCDLTVVDLKGCENLKCLVLMFSRAEKVLTHEATVIEWVGCEVELEPSMKRMRLS